MIVMREYHPVTVSFLMAEWVISFCRSPESFPDDVLETE